jgi:hypothetical protein
MPLNPFAPGALGRLAEPVPQTPILISGRSAHRTSQPSIKTRRNGWNALSVQVLRRRVPVSGCSVGPHLGGTRRADDGECHGRVREDAADRDVEQRFATNVGKLLQLVDDIEVAPVLFDRPLRQTRPPGGGSPRRYLPVKKPCASGRDPTSPMPYSRQAGAISLSEHRSAAITFEHCPRGSPAPQGMSIVFSA